MAENISTQILAVVAAPDPAGAKRAGARDSADSGEFGRVLAEQEPVAAATGPAVAAPPEGQPATSAGGKDLPPARAGAAASGTSAAVAGTADTAVAGAAETAATGAVARLGLPRGELAGLGQGPGLNPTSGVPAAATAPGAVGTALERGDDSRRLAVPGVPAQGSLAATGDTAGAGNTRQAAPTPSALAAAMATENVAGAAPATPPAVAQAGRRNDLQGAVGAPATPAGPAAAAAGDDAAQMLPVGGDLAASARAAAAVGRDGAGPTGSGAGARPDAGESGRVDWMARAMGDAARVTDSSPSPAAEARPTVIGAALEAGSSTAATAATATAAASPAVAAPASASAASMGSTGVGSLESGSDYSLRAAPGDADFGDELGAQVRVLLRDGVREARIQLHPAELGRLQVTVSTDGDQARVLFIADTALARDAIEQSLPRLREMLDQQGLQLAHSDVAERGAGDAGGRSGDAPPDERRLSDGLAADALSRPEVPLFTAPAGRIDTYV